MSYNGRKANLLVSHGEDDKILHSDLADVALVGDGPCSATGGLQTPGMCLATFVTVVSIHALSWIAGASPGVGVVPPIFPVGCQGAIVGH